MSGEAGVCPIGPAAKPANPAPSVTRLSKFDAGTSFADGFACMSTNCAKKNSIPSFSARRRISSAEGASASVAMSSPVWDVPCAPHSCTNAATWEEEPARAPERSLRRGRDRGPRGDEVVEDEELRDRERVRPDEVGADGELAEALRAKVAGEAHVRPDALLELDRGRRRQLPAHPEMP